MESCTRISLSEYIDPDQSQRFDHSGRNESWREPFPPARTCDKEAPMTPLTASGGSELQGNRVAEAAKMVVRGGGLLISGL